MELDYQGVITNQPVVIDNGTGSIKAGFAGDEQPKRIFPNYVGRPKHTRVMAGAVAGNAFYGSRVDELKGLLKLSHPMEHGVVTDWNDMEKIWQYVFAEELKIRPEEHPVLLTEAPLNPRANREKAAEIFFESFNVPALYVSIQAVLALYASGRTTGVVLDSGDGVTHAVPIYEGFAATNAIMRVDLAGRDVTRHLQLLLRKQGHNFTTTAEFEHVRRIKEKACYVSLDPTQDDSVTSNQPADKGLYTLPDGNIIELGSARRRAPEVLFRPHLIGEECPGVSEILADSIRRSDLDLRKTLFANVVLSGGSTLFKGFGDRLLSELTHIAPKDQKIKISAPQERKYSTWIGGSILASLSTFKQMWVTAEEYDSEGVNCLWRKTF
eukprot:Colp12_sorted_trinity150504_noHs@16622